MDTHPFPMAVALFLSFFETLFLHFTATHSEMARWFAFFG
jgi:hypothetical protein